eukprot:scaffold481656_cov17-Prasinocladus_malaysianus.AAC.1
MVCTHDITVVHVLMTVDCGHLMIYAGGARATAPAWLRIPDYLFLAQPEMSADVFIMWPAG